MESFLVSARKYRPVRFADVVGQPQVTSTLKNALESGKVAQAFLFCGPRGVGKTTCARILAMAVNCEHPEAGGEPCNRCASCTAFLGNVSMNIFELDAASNNSVDDIRALIEQVRYAPQSGKKKIYIIDEVHMLSQQAFNAFLKTLEEPPAHAIFILATTEKHKILPTILSRCQIFDFHRISISDMVAQLTDIARRENIAADADALHLIAQKADGAMRDALSLFDRLSIYGGGTLRYADVADVLHVLDYEQYFRLTDLLLSGDAAAALLQVNQILQAGFDPDYFLQGLAEHFRELLVARDPATRSLLQHSSSVSQRYEEQAALAPLSFLLSALSLTAEAEYQLRTSRNKPLQVELLIWRLCYLPNLLETPPADGTAQVAEKKNDQSKVVARQAPPAPPVRSTPKPSAPAATTPEPIRSLESHRNHVVANQQAVAEVVPVSTEPIDPVSFQRIRDELLVHLQQQGLTAVAKILQAFPPRIVHGHAVLITCGNTFHLNTLRATQEIIAAFLNEQLGRKNVSIRMEIDEQAEKSEKKVKIPFTPPEMFASLAERYPVLQRLKDELQLDFDY